ncbi:hypothetical protein ACWGLF_31415 [Streptomyces puniciscabiei]
MAHNSSQDEPAAGVTRDLPGRADGGHPRGSAAAALRGPGLGVGLAEHRRGLRQSGPREHRDPRLPPAWGLAAGDPRYDGIEGKPATGPAIAVPTIGVDGALDPFTPAVLDAGCL